MSLKKLKMVQKMNLKKLFFISFFLVWLCPHSFLGLFNSSFVKYIHKKEVEKVISLLCKKFHVPNDIYIKELDLEKMGNAQALYYSGINVIAITNDYRNMPLSVVYGILLHEFRHYMQDFYQIDQFRTGKNKVEHFYDKQVLKKASQRTGALWFGTDIMSILLGVYHPKNEAERSYVRKIRSLFKNNTDSNLFKVYEFDAELFRINNISCPVCYDIWHRTEDRKRVSLDGYVGTTFLEKHREEKRDNQCCKAHSFNNDEQHNLSLKKLHECLSEKHVSRTKICRLDKECGSLPDRFTK